MHDKRTADRREEHPVGRPRGRDTMYYELGPYQEREFYELIRGARDSCLRLARQPEYYNMVGTPLFRRLPSGESACGRWPRDPWLDLVRETTARGVSMCCLLAIDNPPSGYQRFQLAMARRSEEAGEEVRIVSGAAADVVRRADNAVSPHDWWLIDDVVVYSFFHPRWRTDQGSAVCTWPDRVECCREQWDAAWRESAVLSGLGSLMRAASP